MTIQIISLLIVGIIVFYFLRKEKVKNDTYFGRQRKLTRKEKQILEHYTNLYKPIPNDKRFPNIKRDGFEIEDIALTATQIVYDNPIPEKEDIDRIEKGNLVKLLFSDKDNNVERMWVEVSGIESNIFMGVLRNDAFEIDNLEDGKTIYFHSNNIYEIDKQ